jgi:inosine-uridine nucleoside N-ribohydrolase
MKVHLDTDIGGDTDDACALAMLLGSPDCELVGITTVHDVDGRRAGYARRVLALAGREGVRVGSSGAPSLTTGLVPGGFPDELRHWGSAVEPVRTDDAPGVLRTSIDLGAVVVGIGPFTGLAAVPAPSVVLMGGWDRLPSPGLPQWGPDMDWNVTCDPEAARFVAARADDLLVVPLAVSMSAALHRGDLPRLRSAGPIGALLARQAEAHADEHPQPDERCNFQYDAIACAAALGWPCVTIEHGSLASIVDIDGDRPCRIVTAVDADAFTEQFFRAVERLT